MKAWVAWLMVVCCVLVTGTARAADRAIALHPVVATSWEYVTPGTQVVPRRTLGVGFWQRASGAKPGVGANYVTSMEYQLPEAMPTRIRSATFQFSGKQSQCVGAEPVVIDVYAYAGDGRADVTDSTVGTRVAQMRADCATNPAFAQPIDVTAIVRQLAVPAGIRHVGFNIRKANNRQGPGLFALNPGTLTIVVADQAIALGSLPQPAQQPLPGAQPVPNAQPAPGQAGPNGLIKALGTLARGGGTKTARDQARGEALDGIATLPPSRASQPGQ